MPIIISPDRDHRDHWTSVTSITSGRVQLRKSNSRICHERNAGNLTSGILASIQHRLRALSFPNAIVTWVVGTRREGFQLKILFWLKIFHSILRFSLKYQQAIPNLSIFFAPLHYGKLSRAQDPHGRGPQLRALGAGSSFLLRQRSRSIGSIG